MALIWRKYMKAILIIEKNTLSLSFSLSKLVILIKVPIASLLDGDYSHCLTQESAHKVHYKVRIGMSRKLHFW